MSFQIFAYDKETYIDHKSAKEDGKLFKTGSTMDVIETKSGFLDLMEMTELFQNASGREDVVYGVCSGEYFVSFDEIKEKFNDKFINDPHESFDTLEIIEEIIKLNDEVNDEFRFTISAKKILGDDYNIPRSSQTGELSHIDDNLKMDVIKKIGRAVSSNKELLNQFPEELIVVKEEMSRIQKKDLEETFGMG